MGKYIAFVFSNWSHSELMLTIPSRPDGNTRGLQVVIGPPLNQTLLV